MLLHWTRNELFPYGTAVASNTTGWATDRKRCISYSTCHMIWCIHLFCEWVTFMFVNLYYSGRRFPCCIYSLYIHFLNAPRKTESTVVLPCRAHHSLLHQDDIWHILAIGTKSFWWLKQKEKMWGDILKDDLSCSTRARRQNASICDRCQATCVMCVPSKTSLCWVVLAGDPQISPSTNLGVQWELKRKSHLSACCMSKAFTSPFTLWK